MADCYGGSGSHIANMILILHPGTYRSETFPPHPSKPADQVGCSALVSETLSFEIVGILHFSCHIIPTNT